MRFSLLILVFTVLFKVVFQVGVLRLGWYPPHMKTYLGLLEYFT
jgi:hypothetical protein